MSQIISDKYPIARKEHRCYFCGGVIAKGEKYHYQKVYDGGMCAFKTHCDCAEVAHELDMWDGGFREGISGWDFQEFLREYVWEHYSESEAKEILHSNYWHNIVQRVLNDIKKETKK